MVQDLGVLFDSLPSWEDGGESISKYVFLLHPPNGKLGNFLSNEDTAIGFHIFATSKVDYSCSLTLKMKMKTMPGLQQVQNTCAHFLPG